MNHNSAKVTVALFVAMLFTLTILNLLAPDREMSEAENRYLQQMPAFSWDSLKRGKFTADFDSYITDQFLARDSWVGLKTLTEAAVGKKLSKGVYFGRDNYLMEAFDKVDMDSYSNNLESVRGFSRRIEAEYHVPVQTMLVPSASGVLRDKLPLSAPELDQRELLRQASSLLPGLVDVTGALEAHSGESIYYRTDHHWTSLGAFYAYNAWREQNGLAPRSPEEFDREVLSGRFYGTSYSKAHLYTVPPDVMEAWQPKERPELLVEYNRGESASDSLYEPSFLEQKDKYSAYLNGNQPITSIRTGVENGRRLLVLKDSYANAFVQFLTRDYEEIIVLDLRFYREPVTDLIGQEGITEVLLLYSLKGFAADLNILSLPQ